MQVKEILALAALNLGRNDLRTEIQEAESDSAFSEELTSLIKCYNFVENEIAFEYFPLTHTESLAVDGGKVAYAIFSHVPINVHRVENEKGESLNFKLFPTCLSVSGAEGGAVKVTYSYAPETKGLFDACAFSTRVSARLLSYGVASEFMLACARYGEANMWQTRYREALSRAGILRRSLSVRSRRWV